MPLLHPLSKIVTVDAETFYSKDFGLTVREHNTSSYIRDPRFKEHCWAIKVGTKKSRCWKASDAIKQLQDIDWSQYALLAHNTAFDGFIMSQRYGIVPSFYYDTLSMTRGLHNEVSRAKLDTIAKFYQIGAKMEGALEDTKGIRDLPPEKLKRLMEYCNNDNELCFEVFKKQVEVFPADELELIDMTIRMFCDPVLMIDEPLARDALAAEMIERRASILKSGASEEDLMSNPKFAKLLEKCGVTPPTKVSNKTGIETFAFAQTDPEFTELLDHEDKRVVLLAQGRLAAKSTQAETRAFRLLQAGKEGARLPVGYNYFGAKTGRWSGTNKLNLQNLPRVNPYEPKPSDGLRRSIIAPPGHVLGVSDSAQIEARINAWLCGQTDVVDLFAADEDVYKHMAVQIYGVPFNSVTKDQRFIGKIACVSSDTLVLTRTGWKTILHVKDTDLVWDGEEWVKHEGVAFRGVKPTQLKHSVRATADHGILTEHGWREWSEVHTNPSLLQSALSLANLPSSTGNPTSKQLGDLQAGNLSFAASAGGKASYFARICLKAEHLAATLAQKSRPALNAGGNTKTHCLTTSIARVCLTGCRHALLAATHRLVQLLSITVGAESLCATNGVTIEQNFLSTFKRSTDGTTQNSNSTESTSMGATSRATSGLLRDLKMRVINAAYRIKNSLSPHFEKSETTYDLLSAGPRNRFVIWSDKGPLVVHNCLGLGYGMGHKKFQTTLALGLMGPAVEIPIREAQRIVRMYRARNHHIAGAWEILNQVLEQMVLGKSGSVFNGLIEYDPTSIWLPNGMGLHYPGLHRDHTGQFKYKANGVWKKIYGGLLLENLVQALARIVVGEQMLMTKKYFKTLKLRAREVARVVMMTHDEIVTCYPERLAEKVMPVQIEIMRRPPHNWGADIPFNAEGGYDKCYSK